MKVLWPLRQQLIRRAGTQRSGGISVPEMMDHTLIVGFAPRLTEAHQLPKLISCASETLSNETPSTPLSPLSAAIKTTRSVVKLPALRVDYHRRSTSERDGSGDPDAAITMTSADWLESCSHSSTPIPIPDTRCDPPASSESLRMLSFPVHGEVSRDARHCP